LKTLKKKRRIQVILATALSLVIATVMIGYAMRDGINFFRSPSQVMSEPPQPNEVFRIGGLVEDGSVKRGVGTRVNFVVTDGGAAVPVTYDGVLPDLFEEGQGVVALGSYDGETFRASEILAKHDEEYMPKEVMDALKEQGVYQKSAPGS
jgi:cytochrome c-type biogenesis protein CcmE